jgi:DNA-binding NarL/FixJ family response regulator
MIRLFSIEDHWVVIDGLKLKFRSDRDEMMITCKTDKIDKALKVDQNLFDIILLDLYLPETDPEENVSKLKTRFPEKPIVIYTSEESSIWKDQMCLAGVQAYLTKYDKRQIIKKVIQQVASGEDLCRQRRIELNQNSAKLKYKKDEPFLKPDEKKIISLLLQDLSLKEIAAKKIITGSSVKIVTESAISKMMAMLRKRFHVKTNAALLRIIIERKLIPLPPSSFKNRQ